MADFQILDHLRGIDLAGDLLATAVLRRINRGVRPMHVLAQEPPAEAVRKAGTIDAMAMKTLLTLEHFEQITDDGMRHELDEGELISMPSPFTHHGKIQARTTAILWNFTQQRSLGLIITETGFRLRHDTVRPPDVSLIRAERANGLELERRFEGAPDLAVEIISPSETAAEIAHKVRQYLHAGVEVVWVLYPRDRTIHVFESSHKAQILEAEEMLEAPDLLPGFSVRVSEFFV